MDMTREIGRVVVWGGVERGVEWGVRWGVWIMEGDIYV